MALPTVMDLRALIDCGQSFVNERLVGAKLAAAGFARVLEEEEIAVEQEEVTAAIFVSEELKTGFFLLVDFIV